MPAGSLPYLEVTLSRPITRLGRSWALMLAVIGLAAGLLSVSAPAQAAAPANTATVTNLHLSSASDPSTWAYSIAGALKLNGKPVAGVAVTATLGSFSAKATSDATGRWNIAVPDAGKYTVTIDQSTLPKGYAVLGTKGLVSLSEPIDRLACCPMNYWVNSNQE